MSRQGSQRGSEKCICELCDCGNHRCPHENNGRLVGTGNGPMGQTEYGNTYIHKNQDRTQLARPTHTSLGPGQGQQDINTTHLSDFKQWNGNQRAQAFRPNDAYQSPTSPFDGATTHRNDFNEKKGDHVRARRPPTTNRREAGPFDATTTNRNDYQVFDGARLRSSYRPKSSRYLADAPFNATTEHRSNYDGKTVEVQRAARPITEYQPNNEPLDGNTTYRLGFTNKKAEPAQNMRPLNGRVEPDGPFDGVTTHRQDYIERQQAKDKPCPAEVVLTRKNNNYQHVGQKDGHRFYKRVSLNSAGNRELTRIIG